jgi:hypothetical protein
MMMIFSKPGLRTNWLWRCTCPWLHKMGILILECQFNHQYQLTYISKVTHTYTTYRLM